MQESAVRIRALSSQLTVAAAVAMVLSAGAQAQEVTTSPVVLEAIYVTAERRSENVQDVPISVSTLGDEKLTVLASGGEDIRFLSARIPSLLIESSFGRAFPRFYIRGLGNTDFDLNASQPVSLIYDEVVQENPILKGFPVFDLAMVETFRGPQGTLFGRNTPAGVIKFNSAAPTKELEGFVRATYGSKGTANLEGAVSGPLSDNWSARFSILGQHRDDWVDNGYTGKKNQYEGYDELAARVQFLYDAGNDFTALLNMHIRSLDGTARMFRANIIQPGTNKLVSGFDPDVVYHDGQNKQELDTYGGSLRLRLDLGRVALYSITGLESAEVYSRGDIDGGFGAGFLPPGAFGPGFIPFAAESADGLPSHNQFTQEFRLESLEWGRFDWQLGAFYFDESIDIDSFNYNSLAGGADDGYAYQEQDNEAWALYGSVDYDLTDAVSLSAGLRYTNDKKDFLAARPSSPSFPGVPPLAPVKAKTDDDNVSWDVSATWAVREDTNLFARIATGFRAPSIQGRVLFGDTISVAKAETITSYEAGIKTGFLDNRGRLSFTVFSYEMKDQQLTAVGGQANFNQLINADKTKGQGFELDLDAYLTDRLLVTLGVSYNDTEIDDSGLAIAPCGGGCTVTDPAGTVPGTVIIDGNSLPQAPEWIGNATLRYGVPVGNGELYFYTDWAYRSEVSFFLYESKEFTGQSLVEGGVRIGYDWNDGRYQASIFGRNIADEVKAVGGIDFNNLTGFINEPRTYGVEFRANF
jgi:iron complex outermembrane receptor protein